VDAYVHDFEKLMSVARKNKPDPEGLHLQIQYWIYDYPSVKANFGQRSAALAELMSVPHDECLVYVPTTEVSSDEEIEVEYAKHLDEGYEGTMVRADAPYEPSNGSYRSAHIQKRKPSEDAEFPIVGAEEGKGKDAGTVGEFVCDGGVCKKCNGKKGIDIRQNPWFIKCDNCKGEGRVLFNCRLKASYARRRELHEHPELWRGKKMTVIYQKLSAYGVPMFPRGSRIMEPEWCDA
jgi:DNA ligase-1